MKRTLLAFLLTLSAALPAAADTYQWTDGKGVVHFTDDPSTIPPRYRRKAKVSEDITINNPKVLNEIQEQQEKARKEEADRSPSTPPPDYVPPPAPPLPVAKPTANPDELPPGRTKSQRIRDNIERRNQEEKSGQGGSQY